MDFKIKIFNYCQSNGFQNVQYVTFVTVMDFSM